MSDLIGDITSRIKQINTKAPYGLIHTAIGALIKEFLTKTGINPSWISIIGLDSKEYGLKPYTENLIKNNDLSGVATLKTGLMHPDFITKEALPKGMENKDRLRRDKNAELLAIKCDLRKPKEAPETTTNLAMAQAPKPLITDPNAGKIEGTNKPTPGGEVYVYASLSKEIVMRLLSQIKDPNGNNSYREILGA